MNKRPSRPQADTAPDEMPQVEPRGVSDMSAFTMSATFELSTAVGRIESDVRNLDSRVDALTASIEKSTSRIERAIERLTEATSLTNDKAVERIARLEGKALLIIGGVTVAVFLIPLCAGVVWWALGNQITALIVRPPTP